MCISIAFLMLISISAYANSAPLVSENPPGFDIGSFGNTPVSVEKEDLRFDVGKTKSYTSDVTASYDMKNTSNAEVSQTMIFPFVTSMSGDFIKNVNITADGMPVKYKTYRIEDLDIRRNGHTFNFKNSENKELKDKIAIQNIINVLNSGVKYTPRNFKSDDSVKVYTLHLPAKDKEYRAEAILNISGSGQKVLYSNVNGFERRNDNSIKFSTMVLKSFKNQRDAYFAVIGEDSGHQSSMNSLTGQEITSENMTISEFLKNTVVEDTVRKYGSGYENDINSYSIKKLDGLLDRNQKFVSLDDTISFPFSSGTYIGAFVYTVDFKPYALSHVTVRYQIKATLDKRKTNDGSYMFLYLLRPAASWKDFKNLSIKVVPDKKNPYIIESSLPLTKCSGVYSGNFEKLPDDDFYFATYKTDKPDKTSSNVSNPNEPTIVFLAVSAFFITLAAVIIKHAEKKEV